MKNNVDRSVILFDLDQTLLNRNLSLQHFIAWQVDAFQLVPPVLKTKFLHRFIELDQNGKIWKDHVYHQLIQEFQLKAEVDILLNDYVKNFQKFALPFDGVVRVIQKIHQQGYQLGLVSNGKTPFQEHNFQALGLSAYFSAVVVSEAVGLRKPDAQIFLHICQQLNGRPHQCIFVGDDPVADLQGAQAVGMKTIFFNPHNMENIQYADAIMHHYDELEMHINQLNQMQ